MVAVVGAMLQVAGSMAVVGGALVVVAGALNPVVAPLVAVGGRSVALQREVGGGRCSVEYDRGFALRGPRSEQSIRRRATYRTHHWPNARKAKRRPTRFYLS